MKPFFKEAEEVEKDAAGNAIQRPLSFDKVPAKLNKVLSFEPRSYSQAVIMRQNINDLADWDKMLPDQANNLLKLYSGRLGEILDKQVLANAEKEGDTDFIRNWREQRTNYGNLKDFENSVKGGKKLLENKDFDKFAQSFVPRELEGASKIHSFRGLVGKDADKALRHRLLRPYLDESSKIDASKLSKGLHQHKISPSAVDELIPHNVQQDLGRLTSAQDLADQLGKSKGVLDHLSDHPYMTGGVAAGLAFHHGLGAEIAGIAGMFLPRELKKHVERKYEKEAAHAIETGDFDKFMKIHKGLFRDVDPLRALKNHMSARKIAQPTIGRTLGAAISLENQ